MPGVPGERKGRAAISHTTRSSYLPPMEGSGVDGPTGGVLGMGVESDVKRQEERERWNWRVENGLEGGVGWVQMKENRRGECVWKEMEVEGKWWKGREDEKWMDGGGKEKRMRYGEDD